MNGIDVGRSCSISEFFYSQVAPRKPFPILWAAAGPIRPPTRSSRGPPACQAVARAGWGSGPAAEWGSVWSPGPTPRSGCGLAPAGGGRSQELLPALRKHDLLHAATADKRDLLWHPVFSDVVAHRLLPQRTLTAALGNASQR